MERPRVNYAAAGAPAKHMFLYVEAQIQAIEGRTTEALATLRKWRKFDPFLFSYVRREPFFENLHDEPEFWQIVAEVEAIWPISANKSRQRDQNNSYCQGKVNRHQKAALPCRRLRNGFDFG